MEKLNSRNIDPEIIYGIPQLSIDFYNEGVEYRERDGNRKWKKINVVVIILCTALAVYVASKIIHDYGDDEKNPPAKAAEH